MNALLQTHGLSRHFGGLKAVSEVSLAVAPRSIHAILGPNGAGKTTLFNAITGMLRASTGAVLLDGKDITRRTPNARALRGIARTFQITNLFFGLSVQENLLLATRGLGRTKFSMWRSDLASGSEEQVVETALAKCHLVHKRDLPVKELAYGEQRQLELAMSLTSSPRLLLLDEPAAGLSAAERAVMANVIRGLPSSLALILIEHDIDLALGLVDRVVFMAQGTVLVEGKPDEIRRNAQVQEIYLGRPRRA
jgi:branched-chain amino acid transport system ATP-binding protein